MLHSRFLLALAAMFVQRLQLLCIEGHQFLGVLQRRISSRECLHVAGNLTPQSGFPPTARQACPPPVRLKVLITRDPGTHFSAQHPLLKTSISALTFILLHFPLQKRARKLCFSCNHTRGQNIGRAKLVFRGPEITNFYLALFSQCTQTMIYCANAYTQLAGDLSLIKVSLIFQRAKARKRTSSDTCLTMF